jgi:hypothetical protein
MNDVQNRGIPRWREKQRALPVALKIERIGQFIQETRQLEKLKKSCKPFATSSNSSSSKGS